MTTRRLLAAGPIYISVAISLLMWGAGNAFGQGYGIELQNTVMPASGAMGGASLARPQDVPSAINGNPATLTQFAGTQFTFSGGWIEPSFNLTHTGGVLPNVGAFSAKSEAEGALLGNIGVIQDVEIMGRSLKLGTALVASSGAGANWVDVPASNGTTALIQALGTIMAAGVEVTDRCSLGGSILLGAGVADGPFLGITNAVTAYKLRGSLGLTYELDRASTFGAWYQTRQNFNFDNAVRLALPGGGFDVVRDVNLGLPENIGFGVANQRLMDGRLLFAIDVIFKMWDRADLVGELYNNQWVYQFGTQYQWNDRTKLRLGYAYAQNVTDTTLGTSAGGIEPPPPVGAGLQYVQALFPNINEHRISGGIGIAEVLPNVDLDLFAGGMFDASQQFGPFTSASLATYWAGFGLTWKFGGGCEGCGGCGGSCSACHVGCSTPLGDRETSPTVLEIGG